MPLSYSGQSLHEAGPNVPGPVSHWHSLGRVHARVDGSAGKHAHQYLEHVFRAADLVQPVVDQGDPATTVVRRRYHAARVHFLRRRTQFCRFAARHLLGAWFLSSTRFAFRDGAETQGLADPIRRYLTWLAAMRTQHLGVLLSLCLLQVDVKLLVGRRIAPPALVTSDRQHFNLPLWQPAHARQTVHTRSRMLQSGQGCASRALW